MIDGKIEPFGQWQAAQRWTATLAAKIQLANERAARRAAALLVRKIKKGIVSQAPGGEQFKELEASTKAKKGSSKALLDMGVLLSSITELVLKDQVFVGILYTARYGEGNKQVANIGAVMEFGATMDMPNGATVTVPPRPFLGPVMKKELEGIIGIYKKEIELAILPKI